VTDVRWLTAFLDLAADEHAEGLALWERLTGYRRSSTRGDDAEFVSLLPPDGDEFLRVQRLGSGQSRIHLDVHVDDPFAAAEDVVRLGATVVADHDTYLTLASPGGFTFCLVPHPASRVPEPTEWPSGLRSVPDQVCLDIPPSAYDAEFAFWAELTGWSQRPPRADNEFSRLTPADGQPLQLLLQRLDDEESAVRAHLDWSASDRDAEVARHVAAGATRVQRFDRGWTVMTGPDGLTYCVTERGPGVRPT
jgi:hypothetical protein